MQNKQIKEKNQKIARYSNTLKSPGYLKSLSKSKVLQESWITSRRKRNTSCFWQSPLGIPDANKSHSSGVWSANESSNSIWHLLRSFTSTMEHSTFRKT